MLKDIDFYDKLYFVKTLQIFNRIDIYTFSLKI